MDNNAAFAIQTQLSKLNENKAKELQLQEESNKILLDIAESLKVLAEESSIIKPKVIL